REATSANEAMIHALAMDSAVDGISILGKEGEHLYVNSAFAKMMGFEPASTMVGKSWREVYDERDVALLEDHIRNSLKQMGKWSEQVSAVSYVAEVGVHGKWHYVSPQVETILGYTQEEWLAGAENWILHVWEEDYPIVEAAEENFMQARCFQAEYRLRHKDGRIIWVSDNAVFVPGSESHPLMEGIIVDITERRLLENQLQQARRMEAVGRLAGGVAHDFNNLLTIIKGYVELTVSRVAAHPELRGNIQQIADAADRAVTLVRQLLAFSRKQVLKPKVLDLN